MKLPIGGAVEGRVHDEKGKSIGLNDRWLPAFSADGKMFACGKFVSGVQRIEIWLEKDTDPRELIFILAHEYLELRMMHDGRLGYDHAHEIASRIEFQLRCEESDLPVATGRRIRRADIPNLAEPEVYDHLREHYM